MKKKLECDIHKQKLIIVDLSVKLLQWISRDTSMLTIPNLNTKLSGWNQLYHTRSFYISFLQLLIIKFQILNHFWKCICTRKSHQNLHALLYGATIGWFFNSLTDWTDFLYYAVLMCGFFYFWWVFFWFNFCVLVNCIQVLVKKTSIYTFKQEVHGPHRSSNKQFLCKFLLKFLNIKIFENMVNLNSRLLYLLFNVLSNLGVPYKTYLKGNMLTIWPP